MRGNSRAGTRRAALAALAALAAGPAALAAACAPSEGAGGGAGGAGAPPRDYNGTTLAVWGSYGAQEREALLPYYERFAREHAPGLSTELQIYTNAEFMAKLTAALAGGAGPDLTRFKEYQAIDTAARGSTLAVDGLLSREKTLKAADFTPQSIEGSRYRDKLYGVPHHHQLVMLGWNKERFKQAGLNPDAAPQTVDELRAHARRLTSPSGQWGFRQYEFGPPPREQIFNWFMEWVWRNGGEVFNRDRTKATLDAPESVQALQILVDMIYADKSTIPPDQSQLAIESGKLGM